METKFLYYFISGEGSHSQPLSSLPSCELPSPDGEESPLTSIPDHPGEHSTVYLQNSTVVNKIISQHFYEACFKCIVLCVAGSLPLAGGACASCQQHTHSRNSSNTSGDMSSKVTPSPTLQPSNLRTVRLAISSSRLNTGA